MAITLKDVSYSYQVGTPFEGRALLGLDVTISKGSYTAVIGHTGSGKSTLMQLLNGLNIPTQGTVLLDGVTITPESKQKDIKSIRQKVGLVFQFPESQLFEETVLKDVAFGPQNFGVSEEDAEQRARDCLALVGIAEELFHHNPFDLSGGQMRRVAIAGILAMQPEVLVLDEPTAGLDPKGRKELMELFQKLHRGGLTLVLVTHQMDDVANFASHVIVLEQGEVVAQGQPATVFQDVNFMESKQLGVPKITKLASSLTKRGVVFSRLPITISEFLEGLDG